MKTNIIFFLPNLNGGGAERVTINILRQLDLMKFKATLVVSDKVGKLLELVPQEIEIIDLKSQKTLYSIPKIRKLLLKLQPDIIFSSLIRMHIALDFALFGIQKRPKIILRSPNSPKLLLENNELNWVRKTFLEKAYRNADLIIAQTPEMKSEIEIYHHIDSSKIHVFLNPINTEIIEEKIKDIDNPFDDDCINVVAAGRLIYQKGFDILIKSFHEVVSKNSKFKLFIIGADVKNEKKNLEKLVKSFNLEKHIFFLGFQDNPYKFFYFSDLYVLSSRWEGLPNTILENLYLHKPIVATNCIPYMRILIENGKNGLLVDAEDSKTLAKAILDYKKINVKYKTVSFDTSLVEELFNKVVI